MKRGSTQAWTTSVCNTHASFFLVSSTYLRRSYWYFLVWKSLVSLNSNAFHVSSREKRNQNRSERNQRRGGRVSKIRAALKDAGWKMVWVEKKERRGWMKAIVGRMFALIHYRQWPTSTVVSYFEQIVIRRRLDASINAIDGAPRRHRRSSFPTRRPASFFPLPPLLSSSSSWIIQPLENNYIPSTALIASAQTHDSEASKAPWKVSRCHPFSKLRSRNCIRNG